MTHTHEQKPKRRLRRVAAVLASAAALVALAGVATAATSRTADAPKNTAPPSVSGTFQVGETVTGTKGTWTNSPTDYAYLWERCNASGSGCDGISGATQASYKLTSNDVDHTIVLAVTAANSDGKAQAFSDPSPVVSGSSAPGNTSRPTISGTAQVGETLTVSNGTWTGGVRTYTYQWDLCDKNGNNCKAVAGATSSSYGVRASDVGMTVRADVTAENVAGKTTVNTDRSDTIQAAAGTSFTCPSGTTVAAADLAPPVRLEVDKFQFTPRVVTRSTHTIVARFHVSDTCNRSVSGAELWSTAIPYNQVTTEQGTTGSDGWGTLTFTVSGGFPANPGRQQLLAVLVRATKPGGSVLAGVSARRIVTALVNTHR